MTTRRGLHPIFTQSPSSKQLPALVFDFFPPTVGGFRLFTVKYRTSLVLLPLLHALVSNLFFIFRDSFCICGIFFKIEVQSSFFWLCLCVRVHVCGSLITENVHSQSALRRLWRLSIAGGHVADWHLKLGPELQFFLFFFNGSSKKKKERKKNNRFLLFLLPIDCPHVSGLSVSWQPEPKVMETKGGSAINSALTSPLPGPFTCKTPGRSEGDADNYRLTLRSRRSLNTPDWLTNEKGWNSFH